ncbi:MAG: FG-GAP repeat protein [Polyangiaceae bacterium]|nr:FG-GAP repeat protein [Polyangiaceae bacterium]
MAVVLAAATMAAWPPEPDTPPEELATPAMWPDDPAYGYATATATSGRREGQWELFSFIPERSRALPVAPAQEVAAGASVDRAWIATIGSPSVLVAVADSGLDWSERDLFRRVRLNLSELRSATAAPIHTDRSPCAPLDPTKPDRDRFDCNGDGILTVDDYLEHPDLVPRDTEPPGDSNGNGILDGQDLLAQRFIANGNDDDANGYVDDVVGWDFVDDDNDPFDSTRVGTGTSQALAALASTNDGWGKAGACPRCRLLPLRVGFGESVEPQRLGQAIAYGAEQEATVVTAGLETLGMSPHLKAAVDYAWAAGTIVVTSTGMGGSRRPADPSAVTRVLPIGAVTLSGEDSTTATTFLAASPCSNFGGQRQLSAPARQCPPDAAGLVAGIAGLVRSAALAGDGSSRDLSPGELWQLLTMNADDVDVLASRLETGTLAWSQEGFDQHFGHGRVNAAAAVSSVVAGRIPPAIDLVAPQSFDVLGTTSGVEVFGTVSARRAQTYDYSVEWAPGVQPEEADFRVHAGMQGVDASVVTGGSQPLANLDARFIDPTHDPDPDSLRGENATAITLRVKATAHYPDSVDASAELRRTLTIERDPRTYPGFPRRLAGAGTASPKLADLDGDGLPELILATAGGDVHAWSFASGDRVELSGFPFHTAKDGEPRGAAYGSTAGIDPRLLRESIAMAPAIGDVDGDQVPEIVVATRLGQLYVISATGELPPGWPRRLPDLPTSCEGSCRGVAANAPRSLLASPVLAELDAAPGLEVVVVSFDGRLHVLRGDGTAVEGWPVVLAEGPERAALGAFSTPVVADFNGDGIPDLLTGAERAAAGTAHYVLVDGRGNGSDSPILADWPVEVASWSILREAGAGARAGSAAGDFDGDEQPDAVLQGNATAPWILPANPGEAGGVNSPPSNALPRRDPDTDARGIEYTGRFGADSTANPQWPMMPLLSLPALGDLDQDGTLDVVATGASLDLAERMATGYGRDGPREHLLAMWSGRSGTMLPGSPMVIEGLAWLGGAAIVDLTGDDYPEVIVGTEGNLVHAIDACGREAVGWPKRTGQWVAAAPAVADLDGDGHLEVVVVTRAGFVHVWRTDAAADAVSPWPEQYHDAANTGAMTTPVPGRRSRGDGPSLPVDANGRCVPVEEPSPESTATRLVPRGGSCGAAPMPSPGSPLGAWWAACLSAVTLARRRQRDRC